MTLTHIGRLAAELDRAAAALRSFEDFRSPVNEAVVRAAWTEARLGRQLLVAVREEHGTFYRGRITEAVQGGGWSVLADDGDFVPKVTANMFVSIRLVDTTP